MPTLEQLRSLSDGGSAAADLSRVLHRVDYLKQVNEPRRPTMTRIRDILDGGRRGMEALFGKSLNDMAQHERDTLPVANLMLSGIERHAHMLGQVPEHRIDARFDKDDSASERERTEKLARIVSHYDDLADAEMMAPQMARWLVGYGFVPVVTEDHFAPDGWGYPKAVLRDPYECMPAEWGVQQQPRDIAFHMVMPTATIKDIWPGAKATIEQWESRGIGRPPGGDGTSLGIDDGGSGWRSQSGSGLIVVEHLDDRGTTWVIPQLKMLLEHAPNPVEGVRQFHVFKRFSFNALQGQFDQVIGLMASMAKLSILRNIAMEDATLGETNVYGNLSDAGQYRRGRGVVNYFEPGTRVEKPNQDVPYQQFQHVDSLERHLRTTARYSATLDGESPTSWATGRGVEELQSGGEAERTEYKTVLSSGWKRIDAIRLQRDEARWPKVRKPMEGVFNGESYSETYRPDRDIRGRYRTRRVYGILAGWDEPSKLVTGLQLQQAGNLSRLGMMENIDGLESVQRERERIRAEAAEDNLMQAMLTSVQDPQAPDRERALMTLIEMLPSGGLRDALMKFFNPDEEDLSEEEQAMLQQAQAPPADLPAQPPDVQTVMSQLGMGGSAEGGVRTMGQMGGR